MKRATPEPYYEADGITIFCGDCREVLPALGKFDLLLTDPPYGIGADKANAHSSIRDNADWQNLAWDVRCPELVRMAASMAKDSAVWGGNFYTDVLPPSSGWLAWRKPEAESGFSLADMELCWTSLPMACRMLSLPRRDGNSHPTQKPIALMRWCLSFFPGAQTVLDPFLGSGTTLVAAKLKGLQATGIEISEEYCATAVERLRQGVLIPC